LRECCFGYQKDDRRNSNATRNHREFPKGITDDN
jgi:hypothetical protein